MRVIHQPGRRVMVVGRNGRATGGTVFGASALLYGVLAQASFALFGAGGAGPTFFPPAGLTVAMLATLSVRWWPWALAGFAVAEVAVDLANGLSGWPVAGFVTANLLGPAAAAWMIHRWSGPGPVRVGEPSTLLRAAGPAVLLGPALAAIVGASTIAAASLGADSGGWLGRAADWMLGDALGVLVVAPLVLALWDGRRIVVPLRAATGGILLAMAVIAYAVALVTTDGVPVAYLAVPLLGTAALTLSPLAVALAAGACSTVSVAATASGRGTWGLATGLDVRERLLQQHAFWGASLVGVWMMVGEFQRRRAGAARERAASDRLDRAGATTRDERRRRHSSEASGRFLARLSAATHRADVARTCFEEARRRFGVDTLVLASTAPNAGAATVVNERGVSPLPLSRRAAIELQQEAEIRSPRFGLRPADGAPDWWPSCQSFATVPVSGASGRAMVGAFWDAPRQFPPPDEAALLSFAFVAAGAFDRARRGQMDHDIATAFQRSLFNPQPPDIEGLDIATRVQAATDLLEVGGDWFDLVDHGGGTVTVMVGDVMGKGMEAAIAMGQYRLAATGLARSEDPPGMVEALDVIAAGDVVAGFATLAIARIDASTGRLSYTSAGHLPAVLRSAEGEWRLLDRVSVPPLGYGGGTRAESTDYPWEPGSVLVLYTDGVVERRGEPIDAGIGRLLDACRLADPSNARGFVEQIAAVLDEGSPDDDTTIVVVRARRT